MNESDLHIRKVPAEQKAVLRDLAQKTLGTPNASAYVRFLISSAVNFVSSENTKSTHIDMTVDIKKTVSFRLFLGEYDELIKRASGTSSSPSFYCGSLIKTHLHKTPYLLNDEIEELRQSNYQLVSLGRNLNQIAKHLNANVGGESLTLDQINSLSEFIKKHVNKVNDVMDANIKRLTK